MTIESARLGGTLTRWDDERGFGFVSAVLGYDDVFVHISAFPTALHRPALGDEITFAIEYDDRGRQRAHGIRYMDATRRRVPRHGRSARARLRAPRAASVVALMVLGFAITAAASTGISPVLLGAVYGIASILCFATYASDKSAARDRRWRVPESSLHALGLFCGWPGGIVAQELLRHKTQKRAFRSTFWVTVVVNLAGLALLATPLGHEFVAAVSTVLASLEAAIGDILASLVSLV